MPTVAVIDGVLIHMFFDDHAPPHFHAKDAEYEVLISIDRLDILAGSLPRAKLTKVLKWARDHRAALEHCWVLATARRDFGKIE